MEEIDGLDPRYSTTKGRGYMLLAEAESRLKGTIQLVLTPCSEVSVGISTLSVHSGGSEMSATSGKYT